MPQYTPTEIKNFNQKDKRISWLSIFSSLMTNTKSNDVDVVRNLAQEAFRLNGLLYNSYPILEEPQEQDGEQVIDMPA